MNPRLTTTNNAHEFPILLAYKYFFLFTWILFPFFDFALEREALEFNYLCFFLENMAFETHLGQHSLVLIEIVIFYNEKMLEVLTSSTKTMSFWRHGTITVYSPNETRKQ